MRCCLFTYVNEAFIDLQRAADVQFGNRHSLDRRLGGFCSKFVFKFDIRLYIGDETATHLDRRL